MILEEINRGEIPKPMLIKTDSHGEKQITQLADSKQNRITINRIMEIQNMHEVADLQELEAL